MRLRKRHHWSGNHAPYRNCLHDPVTDEHLSVWETLRTLLDELPDGAEFELCVVPTGHVDTAGRWELVEPHVYGYVKKEQ